MTCRGYRIAQPSAGCGDVLTKPKLDKHGAMCHSSFDCIDCSKRFETPADYKGHTSCISEAEKYQKTLYNGGNLSGPERNNGNQRSRQQGGGRQRGGDRPQWQRRNTNQATGANDTPLGTPVRMSPVNGTPAIEEDTQESRPAAETSKKRGAELEATESKDTSEPAKKKKKKQKTAEGERETTEASTVKVKSGTKRKSTSEVTIIEGPPEGLNPQPAEDRDKKEGTKKKEKRKKKEDPSSSGHRLSSGPMMDPKVSVTVEPPAIEVPPSIKEEARSTKKKPKLKAIDKAADAPALGKSRPTSPEIADPGDRKKRRKSGNHLGDDSDGKRVAQGNDGSLREKRKEKKKKHKSPGQTVDVVE